MFNALKREIDNRNATATWHLIALALLPAFAVSIPYGYLLWDEAKRHRYDFWGRDIIVLLGAPFVGYGFVALLIWFGRIFSGNRSNFDWLLISTFGSFLAINLVLIYFYLLGNTLIPWEQAFPRIFLRGMGLSLYASVITAAYFYTMVSRPGNTYR
jgi:hypothetical protein